MCVNSTQQDKDCMCGEAEMNMRIKNVRERQADAMVVKYGIHAALAQAKWYLSQATGPGMFKDEWEEVVAILLTKKVKVEIWVNKEKI